MPRLSLVARFVGTASITLAAAACSFLPGASPSAHDLALKQLAAHQAIWQQKAIDDYTIGIERQCFCPAGQNVFTIVDGVVTRAVNDAGLALRPDQVANQPKTVPELFALVAALPADAAVEVSWNDEFGFPTRISVDPIPNAIDDEYSIVVNGFTPG